MPVFELTDTTRASDAHHLFGLWTVAEPVPSDSPAGALSFALGIAGMEEAAEPEPEPMVWRVQLPSDPSAAMALLLHQQERLEDSRKHLHKAEQRIDALVHHPSEESFAKDSLDAALLYVLRTMDAGTIAAGAAGGMLSDQTNGGWEQAKQQMQQFLERLLRTVASYAQVETVVEGVVLARTTVDWLGNVQTCWLSGLSAEQMALHARMLSLTLLSQDTLVRTLVIAVQGAIKLSALMTTPMGAVAVLPVAWTYINQILQQSKSVTAWRKEIERGK